MRRIWCWLALVPLVLGGARALLKYAWWAAVHGALHGIPKGTRRLQEADANADFNWWLLVGLAGVATIVASILIPPFKSQTLPTSLKGISRFIFALVLVIGSILIVAVGMSATGYFLK